MLQILLPFIGTVLDKIFPDALDVNGYVG